MEFGFDMKSKILVIPRGYKFTGQAPTGMTPLTWVGKYGLVGPDAFGQLMVSDGINEKGLYVGALYLPGYAKYMTPDNSQNGNILSQNDLPLWILSLFATVEEVKEKIANVTVWGVSFGQLGMVPLHFAVHDATGASIVIEYLDGKLHVHDNTIGVLTNSPDFTWHITNLSNFVNLSANNVPDLKLSGDDVKAIGQGSGMLGLPGDFTPPSRFVRAVALTQSAIPAKNAEEEVKTAFHVLGSFDIPVGLTREQQKDKTYYELTQWMAVADLTNTVYYFKTYEAPGVLKVDLKTLDFTKDKTEMIETTTTPWYTAAVI